MTVAWIPALLRDLTGGEEQAIVPGETVRQVIENKARLCEDGRLRPNISVAVDGLVSRQGLRQRLAERSEVHFLPAMSGG